MNPIAHEIMDIYNYSLTHTEEEMSEYLMHYGTPRHSGRYPWGSGENPYQHSGDFLSRVNELKKSGMTEKEIADAVGLSTTELRAYKAIAKNEQRARDVATARSMREDGYSLNEIAAKMGYNNDSSVRALLNEGAEKRMNQAQEKAEYLKKRVAEVGMIDVGDGVERDLDISKEKLNQALAILEAEGYKVYGGGVPQATNPGRQTNLKILCPPGTEHKEIYQFDKLNTAVPYTLDDIDIGKTSRQGFRYPESLDPSRLKIRYAEEGGVDKDGVIELRRGVEDISLGDAHYAQVRILVGEDRYLKGMAVYSDNMPDGVDVIFNTNKTSNKAMKDVLKEVKRTPNGEIDRDNPFGSLIKEEGGQREYIDIHGNKKLSLINKRAEEGDWGEWADALPSQFLSKQSMSLIKKQLGLAEADKQAEFIDICNLTNPTVKKKLLQSFADDCDAAAVHLKAAALPRQKYQVILPINDIKDNEVYAPNYEDGETVALVRYPHGGTFEIPILKVNNKNAEGRRVLGTNPLDAVGINSKVAERLSGADFDGDTVVVIPCNSHRSKVRITSTKPLEGLQGFDPKREYGPDTYKEGTVKIMKDGTQKGNEMGRISNLITDMTLKGATEDELARAVRHSMVVIDAPKHKLNYKQSEIDNDISSLKKKYQGHYDENGKYSEGSSTLISKAKSPTQVLKRRGSPIIDKETGEVSYKEVHETYVDKNGKTQVRTIDIPKMMNTKDARTLSSGTLQEEAYASYANKMKALANDARKEMVTTGKIEYSPAAKATYRKEYDSLMSKLNVAEKNQPRERRAQVLANAEIKTKKEANPDMTKKELKKVKNQALVKARNQVGAHRTPIDISEKEWEAIQAGAISENRLMQILNNADIDKVRQLATPRTTNGLSNAQIAKIMSMKASGYTTAQIADALNKSSNTITKYLKGKE